MSNTIAIPFKSGDPRSWQPPLRSYIESEYKLEWAPYAADCATLQSLRDDSCHPEVHMNALQKLLKYLVQLGKLEEKCQVDEAHLRMLFTWSNAFDQKAKPVASYALGYEKASVAFNVAAMYSQLALAENKSSADGVKNACTHLQCAAGAFDHLLGLSPSSSNDASADLAGPLLGALQALMLAQAQECFWLKAAMDKMKDAAVARLAAKVGELYETAHERFNAVVGLPRQIAGWAPHCAVKALHFRAAAEYRKSIECGQQSKFGEECGRLAHADALIKKALGDATLTKAVSAAVINDLKSVQSIVQQSKTRADKDNDIIYHEAVPLPNDLPKIAAMELARSIPLELGKIDAGPSLFSKLVPYKAHGAQTQYEDKKRGVLAAQQHKVAEARNMYAARLASMGLPGAIDAFEQPIGLPPTLLQQSAEVRASGGAQSLGDHLRTVRQMREDSEVQFNALRRSIESEENEDGDLRRNNAGNSSIVGRKSSRELNARLRQKLDEVSKDLAAAKQGNDTLKVRYDAQLPYIEALSASKADLEASIPASTQAHTFARNDPSIRRMKQLLGELTQLNADADAFSARFRSLAESDDIGNELTAALNGGTAFETVFDSAMLKYDPLRDELDAVLQRQQKVLDDLLEEKTKWNAGKTGNEQIREREMALQNLANAYTQFKTMERNLAEGIEFYTDLSERLARLENEVNDFVLARKTEKEDILSRAQASSASTGSSGYPGNQPQQQNLRLNYTPFPGTQQQQQQAPHSQPQPQSQPQQYNQPHSQGFAYQQPSGFYSGSQQQQQPQPQYQQFSSAPPPSHQQQQLPGYGYQPSAPQNINYNGANGAFPPGTWNPNSMPLQFVNNNAPPNIAGSQQYFNSQQQQQQQQQQGQYQNQPHQQNPQYPGYPQGGYYPQ